MISEISKVIFLMPPKTASNSIKKSLIESGITPIKKETIYPDIHLFLSEIVETYGVKNVNDYKIVQIVRDPQTRFASSYYHQQRILKNIETNLKGLSFEEYTIHLKDCMLSKKDFFERFYGRIDFIQDFIAKGKSWGGTRLYLNQYQWNDLGANVKHFKLEEISKDIKPLSDYLEIDLKPLKSINTNKTPTDYSTLYSEETLGIVNQLFKKDFELFGY